MKHSRWLLFFFCTVSWELWSFIVCTAGMVLGLIWRRGGGGGAGKQALKFRTVAKK